MAQLTDFIRIRPKLPGVDKRFNGADPIELPPDRSREEIIAYLQSKRQTNTTADLAFYAFRDMETCVWRPFVKAALERNPVSLALTKSQTVEQVYAWLGAMESTSIYEGNRLAQPDEVANYGRGDGLEKAFLLANVICRRGGDAEIIADGARVVVRGPKEFAFGSDKTLHGRVRLAPDGAIDISR